MREVYLDNSATTMAYPEVAQIMGKVLTEDYGNPSSLHHLGVVAEKYMKEATEKISRALKVNEKDIIYVSCGTEGDNLALIGCARANRRGGNHIITSCIEHPAVLKAMEQLEAEGFEVTYLPVDTQGRVEIGNLEKALRKDTILVSVMFVNNEIGTRQPIEEIGRLLDAENRKRRESGTGARILFHTDAVQGFGKYRIYPKKLHVDLMTVSGHKIHGPKGMGFLYAADHVKILPIMYGGGQQGGMRSGTENVPGIAGLGKAVELTCENLEAKTDVMRENRRYFIEEVSRFPDAILHGASQDEAAPHIISVGFKNIKAEVLLHALEEKGIYVSSGSACASNHPGISGVLKSIGCPREYLESTVRFSMSEFTTREDLEYTLNVLKELVPMLRRFTRR